MSWPTCTGEDAVPRCRIGCEVVPVTTCESCTPNPAWLYANNWFARFARALRTSITDPQSSRYQFACTVYFGYALGIMAIDIYGFGGVYFNGGPVYTAADFYNSSTPPSYWKSDYINQLYIGFNAVHLVNALQFVYSWHGRKWYHPVMWPEYLNVLGALLYLSSSSYYAESEPYYDAYDYSADVLLKIHRIELAAAVLEMVASIGWAWSWWYTYPRTPGRGWTLMDPDFHAAINIVVPAALYLAYNIQINMAPDTYGANTLYIWGDASYLAGAAFYWLASLRDAGWWWFMPSDGRCDAVALPPGCRSGEMCAPESAWGEGGEDDEEALGGEAQKGHGVGGASVKTIGAGSTGADKAHDGSLKLYTHPKLVGNGGSAGSGRSQFSVRDLQPAAAAASSSSSTAV